jgi:hypothetical protein
MQNVRFATKEETLSTEIEKERAERLVKEEYAELCAKLCMKQQKKDLHAKLIANLCAMKTASEIAKVMGKQHKPLDVRHFTMISHKKSTGERYSTLMMTMRDGSNFESPQIVHDHTRLMEKFREKQFKLRIIVTQKTVYEFVY